MIKPQLDDVLKKFDLVFFVKFLSVLIPLHVFNLAFISITDPYNIYSAFIDHHLNYITWISSSILHTSNLIDRVLGINSFVNGRIIEVLEGAQIYLEFPCLGLGIAFFWVAFITAHKISYKAKLKWCLTGIFTIWFINIWRIAILLFVMQNHWKQSSYMDHHDLFNLAAYTLIAVLAYSFKRQQKNSVEAV